MDAQLSNPGFCRPLESRGPESILWWRQQLPGVNSLRQMDFMLTTGTTTFVLDGYVPPEKGRGLNRFSLALQDLAATF
jgi:hypothetical protein